MEDNEIQKNPILEGIILIVLCFINFYAALVFLIYMFLSPNFKSKMFKKYFKFDKAFKRGIICINHHQVQKDFQRNTQNFGACALQAFEIFKQLCEESFNPKGFLVNLNFSYLDESFKQKHEALIEELKFRQNKALNESKSEEELKQKSLENFCFFLKKLFSFEFKVYKFENIARLRQFLSKKELLNEPCFCRILGKNENHINIIYKDKEGILSINTNENFTPSKKSFTWIKETHRDKEVFEIIAKNFIDDLEDEVLGFNLFVPFLTKNHKYKAYEVIQN